MISCTIRGYRLICTMHKTKNDKEMLLLLTPGRRIHPSYARFQLMLDLNVVPLIVFSLCC